MVSRSSSPPSHPVLCLLFTQLKLSHILHYTLVPCFSASASTFFTFYHHIAACCHPIILVLTFNMPKPFPIIPLLQLSLFCASSCRNLSFLISSTTHSCHVFLPLPLPFSPSTTVSLHAATQSSLFLRSTCPLIPLRYTTDA